MQLGVWARDCHRRGTFRRSTSEVAFLFDCNLPIPRDKTHYQTRVSLSNVENLYNAQVTRQDTPLNGKSNQDTEPRDPQPKTVSFIFPSHEISGRWRNNETLNNNAPPGLSRPWMKLQTPGKEDKEKTISPMRYLPEGSPACIMLLGLQRTRNLCIAPVSLPS